MSQHAPNQRAMLATTALVVGILAALLATYALAQRWHISLDIGNLYEYPYLHNFHAAEYSEEHQLTYRWTRPQAAIVLPGVGQLERLVLRVHGDYPGMPLAIATNAGTTQVSLRHGWQRIELLPPATGWNGDVQLALAAPVQVSTADERERGIAVDWLRITGRGGIGSISPLQVVLLGASAMLATLLAGHLSQRWWVGAIVGVSLAIGCSGVLLGDGGAWRLMLTNYTARMTLAFMLGGGLVLAIERGVSLLANHTLPTLRPAGVRWIAAAALLTFLLRFGGMAYPLTFISDIRFTMARATLVREGELLSIALPNPSLTPVQWETEATIPRSPMYYLIAAPLTGLPGSSARLSVMALTSSIDALAVVVVALMVLHAGGGGRAATVAALLAGCIPLGLLAAVSWGLFPTLLAQAMVLLAMLTWLLVRPRLHRRSAWLLFTAVLALAYLAYPTALLFLGTTWAILLVLLMLRRDQAIIPTLSAGVVAAIVAVLVFYGWHIPAMLEQTLPMLLGKVTGTPDGGSGGSESIPLADLISAVVTPLRVKYGGHVLSLALGGFLLLLNHGFGHNQQQQKRQQKRQHTRDVWLLLLAWGVTFPIMALMSRYVVTFILKDVFYMLPALALTGGVFLGQVMQRRTGRLIAAVVLAMVCWQGLTLELHAIVYEFVQLK